MHVVDSRVRSISLYLVDICMFLFVLKEYVIRSHMNDRICHQSLLSEYIKTRRACFYRSCVSVNRFV